MRVVCADRDPLVLSLLRARFTLIGWEAACVGGAVSALEAVRSAPTEAVITDIQLEASTGLSLIRSLRTDDDAAIRRVPIVVLSHLRRPEEIAMARRLGAQEFVHKPFDLVRLQHLIERLVVDRLPE